jgi:hypothetical protein
MHWDRMLSSSRLRHLQALCQGILKACCVAGGVFQAAKVIDSVGLPLLADDNPYVSQLFLDFLVTHEHLLFRRPITFHPRRALHAKMESKIWLTEYVRAV